MLYANGTRFLHICTLCGQERYSARKHNPSGLCNTCALTLGRKKHPLLIPAGSLYAEETLARFWGKVDKDTPCACHSWEDRCWLWTAHVTKKTGYGTFAIRETHGKPHPISAHRFAYQSEHGALQDGIYVLHRPPCLLRHCVRHLYAGTPQENTDDAKTMRRFPTGEQHAIARQGYVALPRGDNHWTHVTPELLSRGDDHWTHATPERVQRGTQHHWATITEADVRAIREEYAAGISQVALAIKHARSKSNIRDIVHRRLWKHIP